MPLAHSVAGDATEVNRRLSSSTSEFPKWSTWSKIEKYKLCGPGAIGAEAVRSWVANERAGEGEAPGSAAPVEWTEIAATAPGVLTTVSAVQLVPSTSTTEVSMMAAVVTNSSVRKRRS